MVDIVDKRQVKNKSGQNRRRFLKRYMRQLRQKVMDIAESSKNITDFDTSEEVVIDDITEPTFRGRANTGQRNVVLPGNRTLNKGDAIVKPRGGEEGKGAQGGLGEDYEDEFTFTLTKDEFIELYFSDMELPRFIKDGILKSKYDVRRRAGYAKEGIPARLNLKKTFENAIARKIIAKSQGKKSRYLDDTDLRYDYYKVEQIPKRHALMFCLLDVSGSMGEHQKGIAKKFFLLLYLFLQKQYESTEVRFITHTTNALEVPEHEFFYSNRSGGTVLSTALELTLKIIDEEVDVNSTNIYVSQISDGDNFYRDNEQAIALITQKLLPLVQYYAYVQVEPPDFSGSPGGFYKQIEQYQSHKCKAALVNRLNHAYYALRELFKSSGAK